MLGIASVLANHKSGQVRILAVSSAKRAHEIPDIPSISETIKGYDASLWQGLAAPRGTPLAVIERIQRDVRKALASADVVTAFDRSGTYIVATNPKALGDLMRIDFEKWGRVAKEIGLQVD
jgi:tripartite-type tricarboxylate transporter receptor subunit TctC